MDLLWSTCVGLGLSAACGFRIFLPMLAMGLAANTGHLTLAQDWMWVASPLAMVSFGVATICEIGAYYFPWVDNLLDTIATPTAVVAGVIATSSVIGDASPMLTWTVAVIGGGGSAAVVQVGTGLARQASTLTTGGLANPILSTLELMGAALMSLMAMLLPFVAVGMLCVLAFVAYRIFRRLRRGRLTAAAT